MTALTCFLRSYRVLHPNCCIIMVGLPLVLRVLRRISHIVCFLCRFVFYDNTLTQTSINTITVNE